MKLFTAKDIKKLPAIGATAEIRDPMVWVKLFHPRRGTWFITEYDGGEEAFGYVMGLGGDELGYISIGELKRAGVERDMYFTPKKLSQAKLEQKKMHGESKELTMGDLIKKTIDKDISDFSAIKNEDILDWTSIDRNLREIHKEAVKAQKKIHDIQLRLPAGVSDLTIGAGDDIQQAMIKLVKAINYKGKRAR